MKNKRLLLHLLSMHIYIQFQNFTSAEAYFSLIQI